MTKRLIWLVVFIILLGVACFGALSYLHSFQEVTIQAPKGSTITLYSGSLGEDGTSVDKNSIVMTTTDTVTKKIKKGSYVYIVDPNNDDYKDITSSIDIGSRPINIKPQLIYSDKKLSSLALSYQGAIDSSLRVTYPVTMGSYSLGTVKAFGDGTWYGAVLKPNDTSQDTYLAVFKRDSLGEIQLVSKPPSIVISAPVYPEIPKDIVSSINRLVSNN